MMLTDAEYAKAATTLTRCGIIDSDLATSFGAVMRIAGDIEYGTWLEGVKKLTHQEIAATYGHDSMRSVLALARH